ncbi:hypothetical protein DFJ73DRAFT_920972 [Zopfochytrium polystomum]|nr:hypothetical protein DFJ73DRAFT_920972 [Zopfochytrium polystomum]
MTYLEAPQNVSYIAIGAAFILPLSLEVIRKRKALREFIFLPYLKAQFIKGEKPPAGSKQASLSKQQGHSLPVQIEGISQRTGRVLLLPDFVAVIDAFLARYPRRMDHRFFVDESNSFGVLTAPRAVGCPSSSSPAQTGLFAYRGIRFDPRTSQHVFAGSLSRAVAAQGGFAAGNEVTATTYILKHRSYLFYFAPRCPVCIASTIVLQKV